MRVVELSRKSGVIHLEAGCDDPPTKITLCGRTYRYVPFGMYNNRLCKACQKALEKARSND